MLNLKKRLCSRARLRVVSDGSKKIEKWPSGETSPDGFSRYRDSAARGMQLMSETDIPRLTNYRCLR